MRSHPPARPFLALVLVLFALPVVRAWAAAEDPEPVDGAPELVVEGRIELPSGEPAAGVLVRMNRWRHENDRERRLRIPDLEGEPSTRTSETGAFRFSVPDGDHDSLSVEVREAGFAHATRRLRLLRPGRPKDVGTLHLRPSAAIEVRVLGADGEAAAGEWFAVATTGRLDGSRLWRNRAYAKVAPETGVARLAGLVADEASVFARALGVEPPAMQRVRVTAGENEPVIFRYTGPDTRRIVTCRVDTGENPNLWHWIEDDVEVTLRSESGEEFAARPAGGDPETLRTEPLPDSAFELRLRHRLLEDVVVEGVRRGDVVELAAQPLGSLSIRAVDSASGEEIHEYQLETEQCCGDWRGGSFSMQTSSRWTEADGVHRMFPLDGTAVVTAEGYGEHRFELSLADGDHRQSVVASLDPVRTVRGRVLAADGVTGCEGAIVFVAESGTPLKTAKARRSTTTDADGSFELPVAPGEHALHAVSDFWTAASIDPLRVSVDEAPAPELVLPARQRLVVELGEQDRDGLRGHHIVARPAGPHVTWYTNVHELEDRLTREIGDAGELAFDVPPGEVMLLLASHSNGKSASNRGLRTELATHRVPADVEARVPLDLSSHRPGVVRVEAFLDGRPAAGYVVVVAGLATSHFDHLSQGPSGALKLTLDERGECVFEALPPGTYRIHLQPSGGLWDSPIAERLVVEPDDLIDLEYDRPLVTGNVRLWDPDTDSPLANAKVDIDTSHGAGFARVTGRLVTDAEGWLELTLPPGTHALESRKGSQPDEDGVWGVRRATLRWTESGPANERLTMGWIGGGR